VLDPGCAIISTKFVRKVRPPDLKLFAATGTELNVEGNTFACYKADGVDLSA
jgi:hypothetical protein